MDKINKILESNIDGVNIYSLRIIEDERGNILHILRNDCAYFKKFGEVYCSFINKGHIKAWKRHKLQTQFFSVPIGNIKLVIYDSRENSPTKKNVFDFNFGINNYCLVEIPPLVWYGFKSSDNNDALVINCSDLPHDPKESERLETNSSNIPYLW
ncbi:MAG: dTDP-4-dehydrorhamnose 3,5-epimerase family protein [Silvanigrellaceae bacterium]|nr:dTDP-4-dehydrorhamnose 3,5-epimerase family protein [Silvanigrellaceae bacterium]